MNGRVLLVAVALAFACGRRSQLADYAAPEGDFRIKLPGAPSVETSAAGTVYKLADGDTTYIVRRMPSPPEFASDSTPERFYDSFQQSGVQALQGALQGQRPVTSGTHAGREFVIHAESKKAGEPYEMTTRIFQAGPQFYVVMATHHREAEPRSRSAAVLD